MATQMIERVPGAPIKLSWGAIFGGTFVALGIWVLLYALGLALGLSSVDPSDPASAKSAGIGTGIWSLIAPLIALFLGGLVAARTAGVMDKLGGAIHGAVLWSFTTLAGVVLMGFALSSLLGAVFSVGKAAVSASGQAVSGAITSGQGGGVAQAFGLDANDALAPVNERLQQGGQPPITAEQLQAAVKDVVGTAVREGRFDRQLLISSLAQNTALSRQDAEEVAGRVEAQWSQAQGQAGGVKTQVQQGALKAADNTGKAFWGVFAALFLGLISAIIGATSGVSRRQRVHAEGAVIPRQEVYP